MNKRGQTDLYKILLFSLVGIVLIVGIIALVIFLNESNDNLVKCKEGGKYNEKLGKCVYPPVKIPCPNGTIYNAKTKLCEKKVQYVSDCPGFFNKSTGICSISFVEEYTCDEGVLTQVDGVWSCVVEVVSIFYNTNVSNNGSSNNTGVQLQTCSQLNGNICSSNQTCNASFVNSSDSLSCCSGSCVNNVVTGTWGRIANSGYEGERIASTLYFPGVPKDETVYTANPLPDEKGFTEADINLQLGRMKSIGINAVQISYWGKNISEGSGGLPMNAGEECIARGDCALSRTQIGDVNFAYTRLVNEIEKNNLLFFPMIETWEGIFDFSREFPNELDNFENRVEFWVKNYGNSSNWVTLYDKNGNPKKLVSLILTNSPNPINKTAYCNGFKNLAKRIKNKYGLEIGFSLDPPQPSCKGASAMGPYPSDVAGCDEVLAIIPFLALGPINTIECSRNFINAWSGSNFPVVTSLHPGYDGHIVFPNSGAWGMTDEWRNLVKEVAVPSLGTAGISLGPWNGWTEYYHLTCSLKEGAANLKWAKECIDINKGITPNSSMITCPVVTTYTCPNTICEKNLGENSKNCPKDCY